ncbi:hypothetical protein glysoja_008339 [Glycine soja]|nr:hypothetical protein glysoja_008339 [Glycine soja]
MKFCIFCHSVLGLIIPLRTVSEHEKGNKMRYTIISHLNSWFGEIIRYDKLILLLYHILFTGQNFILWSRLDICFVVHKLRRLSPYKCHHIIACKPYSVTLQHSIKIPSNEWVKFNL